MAITAGTYELRSILLTSMTVTGSGYTPVKGSNVFLYSNNDGNNRKWRLSQSGTRWRLQNAANGLYMTLGSSTPANGVNVRQWTSSTAAIQYWNVIDTGSTVTLDGYECPIVRLGSYATSDGATWMLDVDRAMTTNNANMEVNRSNSNDSQTFALFPVTLLNSSIAAPTGIGWAASVGGTPSTSHADQSATALYLAWQCPSTWMPDSSHAYERRVRKRSMDAATSTWGAWGEWTQWADVDPIVSGRRCYDGNAVDASFGTATTKAVEYQAQVRGKTSSAHGSSASATLRNVATPTVTIAGAGASADGFLVSVTSDYAPTRVTITSIDVGGTELLSKPLVVEVLKANASVPATIAWGQLLALDSLPDVGATATALYSRSTDLIADIDGSSPQTAQFTLTYGDAPTVAPTIVAADGYTLEVTHAAGVLGAWTSDGNGVYPSEGGRLVYPFGRPFDVLVAVGDGTLYQASMTARSTRPCHAWTWDGGTFLLEHTTNVMETTRSVKANANALELNARPWQTVTFSDTMTGEFRASGVLWEGSGYDVGDLMALMRAHHATYRAPSGEVAHVAVTDASYTVDVTLTDVSVTMTQETR